MANVEEIDKAIAAHGNWKTRLKTVIDSGKTEIPVETIQVDNQCAFGKWLYGPTISAMDKASPNYNTVKALHAEFHKTAAGVASLAVAGKKAEALAMMALNGAYSAISAKLTTAMMEWKKHTK